MQIGYNEWLRSKTGDKEDQRQESAKIYINFEEYNDGLKSSMAVEGQKISLIELTMKGSAIQDIKVDQLLNNNSNQE